MRLGFYRYQQLSDMYRFKISSLIFKRMVMILQLLFSIDILSYKRCGDKNNHRVGSSNDFTDRNLQFSHVIDFQLYIYLTVVPEYIENENRNQFHMILFKFEVLIFKT